LKVKFDVNILKYMSFFEKITRSKLKDCFEQNEMIVFVVDIGFLAKAIGKNAQNLQKLKGLLNRKIKIVEFNPHILKFIKNYVWPNKVNDITIEDKTVTIEGGDTKSKGLIIGRNAMNLRNLEQVVRRYFEVDEIKVI